MIIHVPSGLGAAGLLLATGLLTASLFTRGEAAETVPAAPGSTSSPTAPAAPKASAVENSVVKIYATVRYPDPARPWTKADPSEVTGSGVVIERKRILSNAHVVLYASQVQVQANQAGERIPATVEFVAPDMDLAVLKLNDEAFFDSHPPLPRANALPEVKEVVMAYGYPTGGSSLSITKGIVSRIEFASYHSWASGLRIQIDAAINPGNSGGPAVVNDKLVGLTFAGLRSADNIGYIIPAEEVELFLQDIADGHYDGKPAMFERLQTFENPALRPFLKLDKSVEGMLVNEPFSSDPGYPLKKWDVITKIGDTRVDNQGMIKLSPNLRVNFLYLVQKATKNSKLPLTVVRAGKEIPIELPVSAHRPSVLGELQGAYPSYFVYGPIVFSSATTEFLGSLGRSSGGGSWSRWLGSVGSPLLKRIGDKPAFDGERLVVVSSSFFPHKLTYCYDDAFAQVVKSVNDVRIKNLGHLVEVLRDSRDEFITIVFDSMASETLVFPRAEMLAATEDILADNGVRSQGTPDTMAIWNAKPSR